MHLHDIFGRENLETEATTKESLVVRTEGRRRVRRRFKYYNLDAIISLGYRINTKFGGAGPPEPYTALWCAVSS